MENMQTGQEKEENPEGMLKTPKEGQEQQEPAQENVPLEEILAQVEQCIAQLEDPQISLEDSFRCYEEGIRKLKICNEKVDQIEKKMLMINEHGELEEF